MPLRRRRHQQQAPAPSSYAPASPLSPPARPARLAPDPDQPIGVRPRWQVERLRDEAHRWKADAERDPYTADGARRDGEWPRGIVDAARWALGELEAAPITGTRTGLGVIPNIDLMEDEDDKAEWALRHPREAGYSYDYSNGVQHTMMWIVGATESSPILFGDEIRL